MKKEISVIMLTYNREALVGQAVESILGQTFRDFELIIVDNGSTDRSGQAADGYAARDRRVRVVHRARGNIGAGRNTGLDAAEGEWIAFVDDDDWCEPDFLEFLYRLAVSSGAKVAMCGATGREVDERRIYDAEDALVELFWRRRFNVQFPTKLIHRSLFEGTRFSEAARYDDIELMPLILAKAGRAAYHGLAKYTFRRHEGNHSAWTTDHRLLDAATLAEYLRVYQKRTEWLSARFPDRAAYWRYFDWSFRVSMVQKITQHQLQDCYPQREQLIGELRAHAAEFLGCPWILDYEKEWMEQYVNAPISACGAHCDHAVQPAVPAVHS